ncbi:MAG: translocation/assembly module TamB domain-containing protein [Rikenellaceae bacterium]|nr:translocation/assembly module TamB domain-containing protein [Rikenellaceae bacterium]
MWVILGLLFLPLLLSLLLALPAVQNVALDAVTRIISRRIDTEISIGRVDVGFGGRVIVEDFYVEDYERDTLLYVSRLDAFLPGLGLSESGLRFTHGHIDGVKLYLRETPSGDMNIKQVVNRISDPDREKKGRFHLELRDAEVSNLDVIIEQQEHRNPIYGVDYGNMRILGVGADVEELIIDGQVIVASIEGMHFREQSGFVLDELTGRFYLTNGCIGFEDTRLRTPQSDLHLSTLALVGNDWAEYKDYITNVEMDITVDEGFLSTDDIAYFAPRMKQWQTRFSEIDLDYRGRVDDFRGEVRSLRAGEHTSLRVKGAVRGIPEVGTTRFDLQIPELHTTAEEATRLAHNIAGVSFAEGLQAMLERLGTMDAAGRFEGSFAAFDAQLGLQTELGGLHGTMKMAPHSEQRGVRLLDGALSTRNFALGHLLDKPSMVGTADLAASLNGRVTRGGLDAHVRADLTDLHFNQYNYDSLRLVGRLRKNSFGGRLVADDKNLDVVVDGLLDWGDTIPRYDFTADVRRVDLAKLNFNKRDSISDLSCRVTAKVGGRSIDDMTGTVKIANAKYCYNDSRITARSVMLTSDNDSAGKFVELKSDFVDAMFRSPTGYRQTYDYLRGAAWRYLPLLGENRVEEAYRQRQGAPNEYSLLDVKVHNFNPIADAISEGLQIADGSSLRLMFNPASDRLSLQVGSDYIERDNLLATNLHFNASNNRDSLTLYGSADHLYVGVIKLPEFSVSGGARAGRVQLTTGFNDTTRHASARIGVEASIDEQEGANGRRIRLHLRPSHLTEGNATWNIISTDMLIDTAQVDVGRFVMQNNNQLLLVDGVASRNPADSLRLRLVNFHIAPFMQFAENLGYEVDARTNGHATMVAALGNARLTADIRVDSLRANELVAPSLRLLSGWDFSRNRAGAAIIDLDKRDTLLRGYYVPNERRYYARLTSDSLNMALLDPILEGVVSGTRGVGDADVVLQGVGRDADLSGVIDVRDMRTTVDFTQVTYRLPRGRLRVLGNHFRGQNITILDPEGNRGTFAIDLNMEHLKNIRYTVRVRPERMLVMNTTAADNDLFYGRLYGTGDARIVGDKGSVRMDITARTEENSSFFMPLSDKSNISNAEFVTFVQPDLRDTTDVVAERRHRYEQRFRKQTSASSQMHINLDMDVRPNVEVEMMVSGSPIRARGEGRLNLEVIPQTNTFEMYGDYMITEGHYNFSLENLISKKFIIESGSLIQWTGDPVDARLDIDALYKLKTSLQPLLQGTADNISVDRSVPVECHIHIGDRLTNPDISFAVRVPEADPETQSIIATALSTPESVDMQFLYLLVFNNFMAENNASSSNLGASASAATGLEFLANQLSRLLSADDYNLVIRYRPKSEVASDEVDFGLSKSLINDRLFVEVEGNYLIDSKQAVNGSMSNFMGEAYVTYNIDRAGALKLKAFTQTIDRFDENQGLQETGIGIYYKEDFDNLRDLWRRIRERFTSKKRKAQREAELQAAREQAFRESLEANRRRKEETNENQ